MWERACTSETLRSPGSWLYNHAKGRIGIFRTADGLFAIDNTCPHYGADLHVGELRDQTVLCPWHRWRFNLATGHCTTGRSFDVATYPVKEEDGQIWIDVAAGQHQPRPESPSTPE